MRVLIADDIESSRQALAELLEPMGYKCLLADNGQDALRLVEQDQPDLVLLDLLMPGMDGFDVTQSIRQRVTDRWLPVIVTSSLQGDDHFIHALSRGADDYLTRPVNPALLQAKLKHYERVLNLQSRLGGLARRQQSIHEHMADVVITVDEQDRVCEVNRAAQEHIGTDLVGQLLSEVLGTEADELETLREVQIQSPKGGMGSWGLSASRWSMGHQHYTTVVLHDLSEQRRIERMKDEFLATVSHELRTPLTSIVGALGLLASGVAGQLEPAAMELAQMAQRNGDRLSHLIDDVLDLTKLEGNRMALQLRTTLLNKLLEDSIAANQGYADSYQVSLELNCLASSAIALVDPDRLMQIMANLLSNAIKHSHKNAQVRVVLQGVERGWQIDVIDTGVGIDPSFTKRLFEKFSQADSSDRRAVGGTGLGLYISRMLVERMGGKISATSKLGQGSTFSVVLPVHDPQTGWVLCIGRDRQRLERLQEWISPLARVETAIDLTEARALVKKFSSPKAVLADPQGQGQADHFCQELLNLTNRESIALTGDSIDARYADQQGLIWMPPSSREQRQLLIDFVRLGLARQEK